jgi:hypothetical protein
VNSLVSENDAKLLRPIFKGEIKPETVLSQQDMNRMTSLAQRNLIYFQSSGPLITPLGEDLLSLYNSSQQHSNQKPDNCRCKNPNPTYILVNTDKKLCDEIAVATYSVILAYVLEHFVDVSLFFVHLVQRFISTLH